MIIDDFLDLLLDACHVVVDSFDALHLTLFDKELSFADIFCIVAVYQLINYIIWGHDKDDL